MKGFNKVNLRTVDDFTLISNYNAIRLCKE